MKEQHKKALYQYAQEKDLEGFQKQFALEVTSKEKIRAYEALGEIMTIHCDRDELNHYFEFCLGRDAELSHSQNKGIFVEWLLIDFLEPALVAGNGQFIDTSYDLFGVGKWRKTIAEFKALAEFLRAAKSIEDIKDYFFEISPMARSIICIDFEKFQKKFPIFLDELIEWLEQAVEQDEAIWLRGL